MKQMKYEKLLQNLKMKRKECFMNGVNNESS